MRAARTRTVRVEDRTGLEAVRAARTVRVEDRTGLEAVRAARTVHVEDRAAWATAAPSAIQTPPARDRIALYSCGLSESSVVVVVSLPEPCAATRLVVRGPPAPSARTPPGRSALASGES